MEISNVIKILFSDIDIVLYHAAPQGDIQKVHIDFNFMVTLILFKSCSFHISPRGER